METKTYKLNRESGEKTESLYVQKGKQQALDWAIAGYHNLRAKSLQEIKGIFTAQELTALADKFNGTISQQWHMGSLNVFLAGLADFENLENGVTRHGADFKSLNHKLQKLTSSQLYFLEDELQRFWNEPEAYGSPTPDLEKLHLNFTTTKI